MKEKSLKGYVHCPKLYARLAWQILFDYYIKNKGNLAHMDNMLCDYTALIKRFEMNQSFTVYWCMYPKGDNTDMYDTGGPMPWVMSLKYNATEHKIYYFIKEESNEG